MSTTRRFFLRGAALGILALPICGMAAGAESTHVRPAGARGRTGRLDFDRIFFDPAERTRWLLARRYASWAFRLTRFQGYRRPVLRGFATPLADRENALAGITDFRALFLLQMMASDAGCARFAHIHHCGHGASMWHEYSLDAYRELTCAFVTRRHTLESCGPHACMDLTAGNPAL